MLIKVFKLLSFLMLAFPFEKVREKQKDFINDVENIVKNKKHLIAHAPTGLGKTVAVLAPVVQYAIENKKSVFFLTPKHTQHQIAIDTLKMIKNKSEEKFISTDIIGKKWLCSVAGVEDLTSSEFTEYCKAVVKDERCKYYNNTRTKSHTLTKTGLEMLDEFKVLQPLHAEEAKSHCGELCTYEVLMELAKKSSVIIADYFHIFSPVRMNTLMRTGKQMEDCIIIVDEAHNLPERVRDVMSSSLTSFTINKAKKEAKNFGFTDAVSILSDLSQIISDIKPDEQEKLVSKSFLIDKIENKIDKIEKVIEELSLASDQIKEEKKKSFVWSAAKFLQSWIGEDIGHTRILRNNVAQSGKQYMSLIYRCLDPSVYTKDILNEAHSVILMSGTLYPMEMYRDILGFEKERTETKMYESPFPKANRLNIIVTDTTTKYSKRSEETYEKIANHVKNCCDSIPGNVAVFYPSYYFRDSICRNLKLKKQILYEDQKANKSERRDLYNKFIAAHEIGAVLMGVQAGSFSEGIDLPGNLLNGVVIVGIPLDKPNIETKALIDYYDHKYGRGWDYGYIYPAMIRSIQAAGRCIRTEKDRGVCIFIDERFSWANYSKVFPVDFSVIKSNNPEEEIKRFFS